MLHASAPSTRVLATFLAFIATIASTSLDAQSRPNRAPQMTGNPLRSIHARTYYSFRPWVRDPEGDRLYFSISNKPSWAQFNTLVGRLTGTPKEAGEWRNIRISVSDGTNTVQLPAFTLTVRRQNAGPPGAVTLSWSLPTANPDGSAIGSLSGYVIHYGTRRDCLYRSVAIINPSVTSHAMENLPTATYYFAVRALFTSGEQGELSNITAMSVD